MQIRVPPGTHNYVNELLAYPSLYGSRISDLSSWARMESHIASVVVVKPTVQELKVTGLKKPIAMFSYLHVFTSILHTKKVKFDRYNDPIINCTHMGQKLTYMVHKDKICTSRGENCKSHSIP